jgi:hypothetical protein
MWFLEALSKFDWGTILDKASNPYGIIALVLILAGIVVLVLFWRVSNPWIKVIAFAMFIAGAIIFLRLVPEPRLHTPVPIACESVRKFVLGDIVGKDGEGSNVSRLESTVLAITENCDNSGNVEISYLLTYRFRNSTHHGDQSLEILFLDSAKTPIDRAIISLDRIREKCVYGEPQSHEGKLKIRARQVASIQTSVSKLTGNFEGPC